MRFLFAFLHNRSWTGLWQLFVPTKEKECFLYYQNRPLYRLILQQHMFVLHSYSWISIKWKRRQNQCTIFFKTYMYLMLGRYWFTEVLPNHGIHLFWRRVRIKKHFIPMTEISLRRLVSAMLLIHLSEPKQRLHVYVSWKTRTSASVIFVLADNGFFTQKALAR